MGSRRGGRKKTSQKSSPEGLGRHPPHATAKRKEKGGKLRTEKVWWPRVWQDGHEKCVGMVDGKGGKSREKTTYFGGRLNC